jgi:acyl-coenzyme A thioesterase PaaI-like protein
VPAIGSAYDEHTGYSTIELHVQFLNAMRQEDAVAEGWIVKRGRSIVFCEAEVIGAQSGRVIAKGQMTYAVKESRPN